jgi:nicotinamidase-related amidase
MSLHSIKFALIIHIRIIFESIPLRQTLKAIMPGPTPTAIVLIDPYNDFLHPEGKVTAALTDLAEKNTIQHIKDVVAAARLRGIPIFYGLHQQWTPNHYQGWRHMTPAHVSIQKIQLFEEGSFGAQIYEGLEPDFKNGDVLVSRHWCSE